MRQCDATATAKPACKSNNTTLRRLEIGIMLTEGRICVEDRVVVLLLIDSFGRQVVLARDAVMA